MSDRAARRLAWSALIVWLLLFLFSLAFELALWPPLFVDVLFMVSTAAFPVVAILILARQPRNRIGWILMAIAIAWVIGPESYGLYAVSEGLPGGTLALALAAGTWAPPIGLMGTVLLLRFPDGNLLSPRWRKVEWLALAAIAFATLAITLDPDTLGKSGYPALPNPIGIEAIQPLLEGLIASLALIPATTVASVVSLVIRFRRSSGTERLQLKWMVGAAGAMAVIYAAAMLMSIPYAWGGPETPAWVEAFQNLTVLSFALIPIAIGFAVLKYRLYDIDVVINKAVVYGVLAVFVTAVYLAIVVGVAALIGGRGNLFLSIVATAIIALAFQPMRVRAGHLANRLVYGKRATPYEVLTEFTDRVAGSYAAEDLLSRMARAVGEGTGARRADVWLRVGSNLRRSASWPAEDGSSTVPVADDLPVVPDADRAYPVRLGDELLGALSIVKPPGEPLAPAEDKLLADLASQAGLVLRSARLIEELRASRQRLVAAQDEERRRLERNIHDGAQQQLVALAVKMRLVQAMAAKDPSKTVELAEQAKSELQEALDDLRDLARGIYPPLLADKGLAAALEAQARKATVAVEVDADGVGRYPQEVEAGAYFCVLEALQNISKYAEASRVDVSLRQDDGHLVFEVRDDGVGFDISTTPSGSGLTNMRDRLEALGGSVEVASQPGEGTAVRGRIPVPHGGSA